MFKTKVFSLHFFMIFLVLTSCRSKITPTSDISVKSFNYPVLKGKKDNPVLRIKLDSALSSKTVNEIQVNIGDSELKNIKNVRVFYSGRDSIFSDLKQFGSSNLSSKKILFKSSQVLKKGINYFWVSYELSEDSDITSKVQANIDFLTIEDKQLHISKQNQGEDLRLGIAVRQHQDDNVHTYRIPGLATTNKGSLLATYDIRRESARDLQGDMDIGVSRSSDEGNTWEPMRVAMDKGEWGGLPEKFNGVSDACILVDKNSNNIFIAGLWMHGVINAEGKWVENLNEESDDWNHQWRTKGSQPGVGVKQTSQFLITKSSDDGKTWSEPINLTKTVKNPDWWLWAPAPGHGITLKDGTLVFPTQGRDEDGLPFSNITYSKDGGKTWQTSNPASHNTTECNAVELNNGSIMLNIRDNRNKTNKSETNGRAIVVTKDLGETWTEHPTSHGALIEPTVMGSIHRHDYIDDDGEPQSILLFSNTNSKYKRIKQTIKVSLDDGKSWPDELWLELDEGQGAGYSSITSIDIGHIGILYEGSQAQMTFQKINIDELIH